eukprot:3640656-Amphidinium_carterae.1
MSASGPAAEIAAYLDAGDPIRVEVQMHPVSDESKWTVFKSVLAKGGSMAMACLRPRPGC